jgi:hypothetical protein
MILRLLLWSGRRRVNSTELSKRSTMDKWKINVIATIKRKLDKRAGVTDSKKGGKKGDMSEAKNEDTHDPDFSPF